jgi:hypothetical protein
MIAPVGSAFSSSFAAMAGSLVSGLGALDARGTATRTGPLAPVAPVQPRQNLPRGHGLSKHAGAVLRSQLDRLALDVKLGMAGAAGHPVLAAAWPDFATADTPLAPQRPLSAATGAAPVSLRLDSVRSLSRFALQHGLPELLERVPR